MGDVVRRILHKVGIFGLWFNYNLKERKDKLPFGAFPCIKLIRRMYILRVTTSREVCQRLCHVEGLI